MKYVERDYYPIALAASIIGCATDDLIHWAANGKIRLGVLFNINGFFKEYYTCLQDFDWSRVVKDADFSGFAYVDAGSFLSMEREGGDLEFNSVTTLDGLVILNHPGRSEGYSGSDLRSVDRIFIHRTDLLPLVPSADEGKNSGRPLISTERDILLKQIGSLSLVLAEKSNRYKRGGKPNALQIAKDTVEILDALPDADTRGVGSSSIRESIHAGIELLTTIKK